MREEEVNTKCITKATQLPTLASAPPSHPHLHRSPRQLTASCRTHSQLELPCRGSKPSGILPGAIVDACKAL